MPSLRRENKKPRSVAVQFATNALTGFVGAFIVLNILDLLDLGFEAGVGAKLLLAVSGAVGAAIGLNLRLKGKHRPSATEPAAPPPQS